MRKIFIFLFLHSSFINLSSQSTNQPKLIVGIVVDQMRYDLLTRFQNNFSDNGLKRLMKKGFFAENMHFNYAPTFTGPGHASIYTGSVPAIHGIAANDWIENGDSSLYCTQDNSVNSIGGDSKAGKMSPRNLKVTTITDQLRLFSNLESKVIAIALKDRGAILPGGHMSNGSYWYDSKTGNWITSSYYMSQLPEWLINFNLQKRPNALMQSNWNLSLSKDKYASILRDDNSWEELNFKKEKPTFPYIFNPEKYLSEIRLTPHGNTLTTELAIAAIKYEHLGKGKFTDFLAVSYSSTDYVGHAYGPYSLEIEDTYYRLDQEIETLLNTLDLSLGKDNYWIFMTADHGVQDAPGFSKFNKIPAGNVSEKELIITLNSFLKEKLSKDDIITHITNEQIYLNKNLNFNLEEIVRLLNKITPDKIPGINRFYAFESLNEAPLPKAIREKLINGYYPRRSGDIAMLLSPNWMSHGKRGTTHGSPYSHDSHIPFIFYGKGVKAYSSSTPYQIIDIAPTLSYLMGTLQPNGCIGIPIKELEYLK